MKRNYVNIIVFDFKLQRFYLNIDKTVNILIKSNMKYFTGLTSYNKKH